MDTICIYHSNCADGFGAAWVVRRAFYLSGEVDRINFYPGVYQKDPPDVTGLEVIMVDFCYNLDVMKKMFDACRYMLVIDHHKTAKPILDELVEYAISRSKSLQVVFDLERSGAGLTWDHYNAGKPRLKLINHIEDRDLWRFKIPGTREIQADLFSYPYEFTVWDRLMGDAEDGVKRAAMAVAGQAIERKHFKDINELLVVMKRWMPIAGHVVPVANLPYTMSSDAGHILSKGQLFAGCYHDTPDGRYLSLRSDGAFDVSEVAKRYGGGGHKPAAAVTLPWGHPLLKLWQGIEIGFGQAQQGEPYPECYGEGDA